MKYVTYLRVSTKQQGEDGLGIQAQRAAIQRFLTDDQASVTEFVEVESGKKNARPQLEAAIALSKSFNCKLVIAKLDRLSRNAGFIFALRDSGVDFVCCDMPDANTLTVGLFAVIAQHERETISKRTKEALAAKKAQGYTLGNPDNMTQAHRAQGVVAIKENAAENKANKQARNIIKLLEPQALTLKQTADYLNEHGYRTRYGKLYQAKTVQRLRAQAPGEAQVK